MGDDELVTGAEAARAGLTYAEVYHPAYAGLKAHAKAQCASEPFGEGWTLTVTRMAEEAPPYICHAKPGEYFFSVNASGRDRYAQGFFSGIYASPEAALAAAKALPIEEGYGMTPPGRDEW